MGSKTGMIAEARKLLGTREQPMGSNHAPPVTTWYGLGNVAWCDESISYEAYKSDNVTAIGGKFAYVPAHMQWAKSKGILHFDTSNIPAGAVVGFRWDGKKNTTICDHVGLCERNRGDGTYDFLEGNSDDQFRRVHRDRKYIACWFMPLYTTTSSKEDPLIGLKKGDKGEAVTALQVLLTYAGQEKTLGKTGVDGEHGDSTAEALRLARKSVGSEAKAGYGDKVTGWAYAQLMCAVARQQGHA